MPYLKFTRARLHYAQLVQKVLFVSFFSVLTFLRLKKIKRRNVLTAALEIIFLASSRKY